MNSTDINTLDFSVFCRTCLRNESSLMPLYDSKAAEMLKDCNFCNVSTNDGGPDKICISCLEILEQSYNFKQLCKKSESVLEKALIRNNQQFVFCKEIQKTVLRNNLEECNTQESSLDSSDLRDDLRRNDFLNKITEINKTEENPADFTEGERHVSEDFISFLDIPLPPPLQHQCQNCSQSFSEENDLKVHQSVHNSDLTCLACSKKFSGRQSLKRHLKIHLIKKPHICSVCSKSFSESYALVKHLRHHSGIPREKKHFCGECGQGFSEPYYLKVHMRKHTGERPLECPNCDKTFADPRSLRAHIMIHTGQRPYKCSYCSKSFVQNANLTKHLRVHTGEKPYACDLCNKKFTQSSSLEKHRATHCNKTYGCSSCSKRFSKKSDLRKHESVHGKEGVTYN